jgi:malic enzyme
LADAVRGADVLVGCSVKGAMNADMLRSMAPRPIVFAMANPDPEISYEEAKASRDDIIFATGRSDYPNQVNNVLGFPFIFRGALDVRATAINEEMKLAATRALAALAKEDVPDSVCRAYGGLAPNTSFRNLSIRACCCGKRLRWQKLRWKAGLPRNRLILQLTANNWSGAWERRTKLRA